MNLLARRSLEIVALTLVLLTSCKGSDGTQDVTGFLYPHAVGGILANPSTTTIGVWGRDADEFSLEFKENSGLTGALEFTLKNLPSGESLIFQVQSTDGSLDPVGSFSMLANSDEPLILASVESGILQTVINEALRAGGVMEGKTIDTVNSGIIWGVVAPRLDKANSFQAVQVLNREDGSPALSPSYQGPFYFTAEARLVSASQFQDQEGSYVFFNVPPGAYRIRFSGLSGVEEREVTVVGGKSFFGYDVP